MKTNFSKFLSLLIITSAAIFSGCKKEFIQPSMEGTWIEIDGTATLNPTGCKLVIDKSTGDVSLCGFDFVHPFNVVTMTTKKKARLFIEDGQMFYRQKNADILWITPIAKEDIYFMDYAFDGPYLWINGDNTGLKTGAKGVGQVFMKQ
jgi:hypothetical protein